MFALFRKFAIATGAAATIATGALIPRPASADTTSTLLTAAAAAIVGSIIINSVNKQNQANQVVGYTSNGGTVYGDGRIVMPNGQTYYNNGQYNNGYNYGQYNTGYNGGSYNGNTGYYGDNKPVYNGGQYNNGRWNNAQNNNGRWNNGQSNNGRWNNANSGRRDDHQYANRTTDNRDHH